LLTDYERKRKKEFHSLHCRRGKKGGKVSDHIEIGKSPYLPSDREKNIRRLNRKVSKYTQNSSQQGEAFLYEIGSPGSKGFSFPLPINLGRKKGI